MKIFKISILLIIISALSACSTPNVTAEKANLFQAAGNIHSGEFDRQLNRKSLNLADTRNNLQNEKNNRKTLQVNLNQRRVELAQIKTELVEIEAENNRLSRKINQLKENTTAQKAKKSRALKKISRLQRNTKTLHHSVKKYAIVKQTPSSKKSVNKPDSNPYKTQLASLHQEVKVLREMLIND